MNIPKCAKIFVENALKYGQCLVLLSDDEVDIFCTIMERTVWYYIWCSARNSCTNDSTRPRFIRMLRLMHKIRLEMMTDRLILNPQTSCIRAHCSCLCWFADAAFWSQKSFWTTIDYNSVSFFCFLSIIGQNCVDKFGFIFSPLFTCRHCDSMVLHCKLNI